MACDICGKTGVNLTDLNKQYQTEKIKQICDSCSKDVNSKLWDLRSLTSKMNENWLQKFMTNMRKKLSNKNERTNNMTIIYKCLATTCKWNENKRCCHHCDEINIDSFGKCQEYEMNREEE